MSFYTTSMGSPEVIVDSSAILAVLLAEPEKPQILKALLTASMRALSAANYLEASIVFDQRTAENAREELDLLIATTQILIVPVTAAQARIAREAYRRFGRGNHPARLNFGDCFAYALAKETGRPLLFKGTDFGQTDIVCVRAP